MDLHHWDAVSEGDVDDLIYDFAAYSVSER